MVLLNKASCMARMHVAPSILRYVHPAFRRFLIRRKSWRFLRRKNISLAKKIRNRSLHYNVLPRAAPFLCSKCGFATVALKRIEEHVCIKKNSSVNDLERDIKVAQMGVRSRCKDAMAVLERIPNPQSIRLPRFRILETESSKEMYEMIPLSSSHDPLIKVVSTTGCCSNNDEVGKRSGDNLFNKQLIKANLQCAESEMAFHRNCICNEYLKRDSSATDSPKRLSAEASMNCTISAEHKTNYPVSKCYVKQILNLHCTACEIESNKFETLGDFHEHIMKCGKCRK
uniref:C2H2-type domain-containing protein n=1 Tax=Wuchereria bancrofti TaxID=6293 RepID=A0AAF5Q408_WUCBA